MLTLCCIFLCFSEKLDPDWISFKPLTSLQVAELEGVGYFVSDYDEKQVRQYDPDWKLVRLLGGPGNGPGEMTQPMHLLTLDNKLYVLDGQKIHVFDAKGWLHQTFRMPLLSAFRHVYVVDDGWVVISTNFQSTRVTLQHYDPAFRDPVLISEWLSEPYTAANPFPGSTKATQVGDDGPILIHPEQVDSIWVYDPQNRSLRILDLAVQPIPIHDDQKPEIVREYNERRSNTKYQRVTVQDVPDYYPLFSQVSSTVTGKVKLSRRNDEIEISDGYRKLHEAGLDLYVDLAGDRIEPDIADYAPETVIDHDSEFIFHTGYDIEEEGFTLYRTPRAAFLETIRAMQQAFSRSLCSTCK